MTQSTSTAEEALEALREGNRRFATATRNQNPLSTLGRRYKLLDGQEPIAVVLGCSDSRVPVEIVFDQGLGDLFVIRVAGNIVAASQIGSIEYAAERFDIRLVVVLGHTRCGAIQATLDELRRPTENQSPNLRSIVNRIRPSVEELLEAATPGDAGALQKKAVRRNVRASADKLRHGSEILEQLITSGRLLVVGAEYSLESGLVEFFDYGPSTGG